MICLLVMLKVKETAQIETVKGLLAEQGRLSRQEPGCLRFEVYHSQNDQTRFVLCEHWDSQASLDVHRTANAGEPPGAAGSHAPEFDERVVALLR